MHEPVSFSEDWTCHFVDLTSTPPRSGAVAAAEGASVSCDECEHRPMRVMALAGGVAAIAGALMWGAKSIAILAGGEQPPALFEVAVFLFAIALIGLHALVTERDEAPERIGGGLARVAAVSSGLYLVSEALSSDDDLSFWSLGLPIASLCVFGALILLGISIRRGVALPPPWQDFPLYFGASAIPLVMIVGGALAAIGDDLLEIPILIVALEWLILGYLLINEDRRPRRRAVRS